MADSLKRYRGKWTNRQVVHLLKRTMFGAKKEDVDHFLQRSAKRSVHELIYSQESTPDPPVNNYNDEKYTDEEIQPGQTWITATQFNGMNNGRRKTSYKAWWIGQMLNQQRTLREKMVLFWHNHFATETNTVDNALMCYQYNSLLRQFALGNFKEMTKAVSTNPAMLRYLNGYASTKKAPDENYGRELQELFTVGKGPNSHYTEDDVKAAARTLTGYKIDYKTFVSVFDAGRHDEHDKFFSSFYGNTIIKGIKGKDAVSELDALMDMIFSREEVSYFICRKLYRFFVYHAIDADTEKNIIAPLAALFRKKNYEIKPVLEKLFMSRHFYEEQNRGAIIKSPVDFTVGLCREFDVVFPQQDDYATQYFFWEAIRGQAANMQQNIGDPPNVAGWQAYYQEPQYDKLWISSDTLPKRNQFTDRMIGYGFSKNNKKLIIDPVAFASVLPHPEDPVLLIKDSCQILYSIDLSNEEIDSIKSGILLSGLMGMAADHYWTTAWNNFQSNPADKTNHSQVINKLKALYKYLMNLPAYQLC